MPLDLGLHVSKEEKFIIRDLVKDLKLSVLASEEYLGNEVLSDEIIKPGLELAGYYKNLTFDKIMVFGRPEIEYLKSISYDLRLMRLHELFLYHIPCIIITDFDEPFVDLVNVANQFCIPVLYTKQNCNSFIFLFSNYLESKFAPKKVIHGTLIEVYNMGVLILGDSGVGKSETALELVKKGHCLVCDDVVTLKKISGKIYGYTDPLLKYHMEVRGLGILDIQALFGAAATIPNKEVDIVIDLVPSSIKREFDRLGLSNDKYDILGEKLHKISIPVQEGRNISIIIEIAVMNERLKRQGHNSSQIFIESLFKKINPAFVSDIVKNLPESGQ
ncbi:MAG: HPr(Ser) kinase/phosphatase [Candidatus Wallbacteria bacterium]